MTNSNRYYQIIEEIFKQNYKTGDKEVVFERADIERIAKKLGISLPKNLGDIIYSFRYRTELPDSIKATAPQGMMWIIRPAGRSRYAFALVHELSIEPNRLLAETKIPDCTPGIIAMYALNDEQALLAKVRYNRLIDVFTGVACYSLQNHLRTTVTNIGQVETDEIYIGVDRRGIHYVFPVQAKGGNDKLSIVQIEQDFALCAEKFPYLVCQVIGAQFIQDELIALFGFEQGERGVALVRECHYRLVPPEQFSPNDLDLYRRRTNN
ncbi:MAG: endonuclease [Chloroflexus sp.]|nr:endonuclease [Chloroflexus sp.]